MALRSASTTIKLFSVGRNHSLASLSAGTSIAAKPTDQKRCASGGNYVYINPIKDNPSWGEVHEQAARTLFLTEIVRGFAVTLTISVRNNVRAACSCTSPHDGLSFMGLI